MLALCEFTADRCKALLTENGLVLCKSCNAADVAVPHKYTGIRSQFDEFDSVQSFRCRLTEQLRSEAKHNFNNWPEYNQSLRNHGSLTFPYHFMY